MIRIVAHCSIEEIAVLARAESQAVRRDRLRVILWAMKGMGSPQIADLLGYSDPWVWMWIRRFNAQGLEGLEDKPSSGRPRLLDPEKEARLRAFVEARGNDPAHARRLHGEAAREFIERELGVPMCLSAAYVTLHRLGYELVRPRPRHENNDPAKMKEWKEKTAPLLSKGRGKNTRARSSKSGSRTSRGSAKKAR